MSKIVLTRLQLEGPEIWERIHRFGLNPQGDVVQWVVEWLESIPFEGCPCERHWKVWVAEHPIRYSDLFAWSVEAHNEVNLRTGRDPWAVDYAKLYWSSRL